jgi:hypothetical protein
MNQGFDIKGGISLRMTLGLVGN